MPAEKQPGKWKSDKDYMGMMVMDHEKDLAAFEKEAKDGSDPNVKSFASRSNTYESKKMQKHYHCGGRRDQRHRRAVLA